MLRRKTTYHSVDHCSIKFFLYRRKGLSPFTAYFLSVHSNEHAMCKHFDCETQAYRCNHAVQLQYDKISVFMIRDVGEAY